MKRQGLLEDRLLILQDLLKALILLFLDQQYRKRIVKSRN